MSIPFWGITQSTGKQDFYKNDKPLIDNINELETIFLGP